MSVTKFPLLVQKRGIWAVLRVQGEFSRFGCRQIEAGEFCPGFRLA